ncbi:MULTISPECIES: TadE family type IV pilus minor pilin [Microbacterium]|uniref:TadE family type IV pilus minor pilin n=1 Tax=Microbacterium TaxID=33882 RepID=UPI00214B7F9B|nr:MULTISPECIES: TadE family type IV pilus minor pilin [unclassified Microbacterium]MCR2812764.1 TadE family protein [Microbacterium sp. zg.Y1084]MDL5485916.1 TadE family type IV pilus minor pilin [Microbacterium sp. zg-Y1211]
MNRRRWDDRGSASAELAVALPAVVVVCALLLGALTAASRQVRLEQGAAQGARLAARGEGDARVQDAVSRAVTGAAVAIGSDGDLVCVTATAPAGLPLPLGELRATACAVGEAR